MVATTEAFKTPVLQLTKHKRRHPARLAWAISLSLLSLQFLPYLLLWDQAYIRIHDTLEGIDYQNLFLAGKTFDYSPGARLEQVMNGLPRATVKTGWSFVALWHWLFGLYGGYIFNFVVVHVAAFAGMYVLLRNWVFPQKNQAMPALGVSLCFGWLPVFTMLGMSVAGLPWVAWAFGRLSKKNTHGAAWLVLGLFPFYSDIVWAGIPVLGMATAWQLWLYWKKGRWQWPIWLAIGCMTALYVAVNWQLFQTTFAAGDFQSHRLEYDYFYNKQLSLGRSLAEMLQVLFVGHHHVGIFVSVPVALAAALARRRFGPSTEMAGLLQILLVISAFYGFYNFLVWAGDGQFVLLKSFKFERVIVLLPFLWLLLFAVALQRLGSLGRGRLSFSTFPIPQLLAAQFLICVFSHDEFSQNLRQLGGHPRKPNFEAFFDAPLFGAIDRHIGLPKDTYRVVSLGMHPSAAQYHGFYTLDRHASLYDLRYKHQFRRVMAGELPKNPIVKKEFDQFGNRCYLFSAELGKDHDAFLCSKHQNRSICQLDLDAGALHEMGGRYLFSAVEIENAAQTGLLLDRVFEGQFWRVHLYVVSPTPAKNELTCTSLK